MADMFMQVNVSFSLSLELLSYQKLPAKQMPPWMTVQQGPSGEKAMVFTQNLLLEYTNQTTQVRAPQLRCSVGLGRDTSQGPQRPEEPQSLPQVQACGGEASPQLTQSSAPG